jgi:hypothetical protein
MIFPAWGQKWPEFLKWDGNSDFYRVIFDPNFADTWYSLATRPVNSGGVSGKSRWVGLGGFALK